MNSYMIDILIGSLNEYQRKAVDIGPGLGAVIGCPGGGKTTTLIARIARLVKDGLPPWYILGLTFTKAAASEMNQRLNSLGVRGVQIGTIHSFCLSVLKEDCPFISALNVDGEGEEGGYKLPLELKKVITSLKRRKLLAREGVDRGEIEKYILDCKSLGPAYIFGNPFGLNSLSDAHHTAMGAVHKKVTGILSETLFQLYMELEAKRAAQSLYNYDDMILWTWALLATDNKILAKWRNAYSTIVVDEAQDSSLLQWDIVLMLAGLGSSIIGIEGVSEKKEGRNLIVYGDISQSIYGWRSAFPEMFLKYCQRDDVGVFPLPINYRSADGICSVATGLVDGREWHLAGKIKSSRGRASWEEISFKEYPHAVVEAKGIIEAVQKIVADGGRYRDCAVLARLSHFLSFVEIECIKLQIPYIKRAQGFFIESKPVKDILAYLYVAAGRDLRGEYIRRTVLAPFKYINKDYLLQADNLFRNAGMDYLEALLSITSMTQGQRRSIYKLRDLLQELCGLAKQMTKPADIIQKVINDTNYIEYLREESGAAGIDQSKIGLLDELKWMASFYPDLPSFLVFINQLSIGLEQSRKKFSATEGSQLDYLTLSTIHQCKGLQWQHIFIGDVVQGRFPWTMGHSMDEELRLLYVAVTRAQNTCHVSSSKAVDRRGNELSPSTLLERLQECVRASQSSLWKPPKTAARIANLEYSIQEEKAAIANSGRKEELIL